MSIQHKDIRFQMKAEAERIVEGYAATFGNKDGVGDIIMPGAFKDALAGGQVPKMLKQHDTHCVIGKWSEIREDSKGLYVRGELANTSDGNDMYELVKMGAIDSLSIGYVVTDAEYDDDIRIIRKMNLWEVSFVTFPANEQARITGVKESPDNLRDFERFLREEGKFSREDATTIALRGFKALPSTREAGEDANLGELTQLLNRNTTILRG